MENKNGLQIKRRMGESVYIVVGGEQIEVMVTNIRNREISLAFNADREKVFIIRKEACEEPNENFSNGMGRIHR